MQQGIAGDYDGLIEKGYIVPQKNRTPPKGNEGNTAGDALCEPNSSQTAGTAYYRFSMPQAMRYHAFRKRLYASDILLGGAGCAKTGAPVSLYKTGAPVFDACRLLRGTRGIELFPLVPGRQLGFAAIVRLLPDVVAKCLYNERNIQIALHGFGAVGVRGGNFPLL